MSSARKPGIARSGGTAASAASSRRSKSPGASSTTAAPSLRRAVQTRLLNDVFESCLAKHPGWKILIVDEHSMKIISSVVGMYDIMERKVTLVESLEKKRAPFRDQGAIYLLTPTEESVDQLIEDFSSSPPLYGDAVFLYFLSALSNDLLQKIKMCPRLLKRVKCLQEINIDFLAKEERAFTLDMRETFQSFYLRRGASPLELKLAEKLVTVCATLNEYPHIRYKQSSAICTSLSNIFHIKMDEFVAQNTSWWYHGGPMKNQAAKRDRATLLLLDRADDVLTPLMHDFTYQPMVHDLLPMDGDLITYQADSDDGPKKKDVLLDEKDSVWVELRGKHIASVIETLSDRIREIMNSSTGSTLGQKNQGNMSLSQMATAMKALPEYQEVLSKLSQHMHLAHECMGAFRAQDLLNVSDLEQSAATGKDDDGHTPKMADVIDAAEGLMMSMKNVRNRLRLIIVLTVALGGLRQQDRRRLMNVAELSRQDIKTLNAMEVLGLATLSSSDKKSLTHNPNLISTEKSEYASTRYKAPLKSILEDLVLNNLSIEDYPSVLPMPDQGPSSSATASRNAGARSARTKIGEAVGSARKKAGSSDRWAKSSNTTGSRSSGPSNFTGGRCIVFTVGGMSFSEIRLARDVMNQESREIVVGSTAFVSPEDFLKDLEMLGQDAD